MHNPRWRCGIHPALLATGLSRDEQLTSTDVIHLIYCSQFNLIKPAKWLSGSQVRGWIHRGAASYESQYRVICNRLWFLASLHKHQGAVTFHGLIITETKTAGFIKEKKAGNLIHSQRKVWFRQASTGFGVFSYNCLGQPCRPFWISQKVAGLLFNPTLGVHWCSSASGGGLNL